MKAEIFTCCEQATNNGGALTIIKTFDSWCVEHFPTEIRSFTLAARLRFEPKDHRHQIRFRILSPDRDQIVATQCLKAEAEPDHDGVSSVFVLKFTNVAIARAGTHYAQLLADGSPVSEIPLFARLKQPPVENPPAAAIKGLN